MLLRATVREAFICAPPLARESYLRDLSEDVSKLQTRVQELTEQVSTMVLVH